jgi:hypothetical protein
MNRQNFLASSGAAGALLHCQQALSMDLGFTQLMKYVG